MLEIIPIGINYPKIETTNDFNKLPKKLKIIKKRYPNARGYLVLEDGILRYMEYDNKETFYPK